jgi:phytanoyl-CoA hydroxylase
MVTRDEIRFFEENGYLPIARFVDPDLLARVEARCVAELVRAAAGTADESLVVYEATPAGAPCVIRRLSRMADRDDAFMRLACHPAARDYLQALLGKDVELCLNRHNMLNVKAARSGGEFEWHTDGGGWGNNDIISLFVAIDPATVENGCLEVVPGSHRLTNLAVKDKYLLDLSDPANRAIAARAVKLPCEPGAGVFFHSRILHSSQPNRTDRSRRSLIFAYLTSLARAANTSGKPIEFVRL